MPTYLMLTKLSPEAVREPRSLEELGRQVIEKIHANTPNVKWICSYAVMGPYDYVDLFEAADDAEAARVALVVRSFGHATTETWPATPYDEFIRMVRELR